MKKILFYFAVALCCSHLVYAAITEYSITRMYAGRLYPDGSQSDVVKNQAASWDAALDNLVAKNKIPSSLKNKCSKSTSKCDIRNVDEGRRYFNLTDCNNDRLAEMTDSTATCTEQSDKSAILTCKNNYKWMRYKSNEGTYSCRKAHSISWIDELGTVSTDSVNIPVLAREYQAKETPPCTVQNISGTSFECVKPERFFWSMARCLEFRNAWNSDNSAACTEQGRSGVELTCKSPFTWKSGTRWYKGSCNTTYKLTQKDDGQEWSNASFLDTRTPAEYAADLNAMFGQTVCVVPTSGEVVCTLTGNNFWDASGYNGYIRKKGLSSDSVEMYTTDTGINPEHPNHGRQGVAHARCKNGLNIEDPAIAEENGQCVYKANYIWQDDSGSIVNKGELTASQPIETEVSSMNRSGYFPVGTKCEYNGSNSVFCRFKGFLTKGNCTYGRTKAGFQYAMECQPSGESTSEGAMYELVATKNSAICDEEGLKPSVDGTSCVKK